MKYQYRIFRYFADEREALQTDNRFFRVQIAISAPGEYFKLTIQTSISTDENDKYRSWFSTKVSLDFFDLRHAPHLAKLAPLLTKIDNETNKDPLSIIGILEENGIMPVFYSSTKYDKCGIVTVRYSFADLHKDVYHITTEEQGLIFSFLAKNAPHRTAIRELQKKGFSALAQSQKFELEKQELEFSDFDRHRLLIDEIKQIKVFS